MNQTHNKRVQEKGPKLFWRSALKASILTNFVISVVSFLFVVVFYQNNLAQLFDYLRTNSAAADVASFVLPLLLAFQVFSWGLYAFAHRIGIIRETIAKVIVFNVIITGFYLALFSRFEELGKITRIIVSPLDPIMLEIMIFIVTTFMFSFLFDFFTKEEEKTLGESDKRLASIPRRVLAYMIDVLILFPVTILLIVIFFVAA